MTPRKFPGLTPDHWLLHEICPVCGIQFKAGDETTLLGDEPASEVDAIKKASGRPYTAVATPVHWTCFKQE